ncbi:MAG: hypothetical protein K2K57_08205 [Oscillospiraceae bacterium]|nr:hypothetical protein [Oscillospiraceae bacterium]
MSVKSLSIRIEPEMLDKLHYVADYEARSANRQVLILIRKNVDDFEKEHGEIQFSKRPTELKHK